MKVPFFLRRIDALTFPFRDKISDDNIFAVAGQSAFFLILSLVPLSMFCVSLLQSFHIPVETLESAIGVVLSESMTEYVSNFLTNVYKNTAGISFVTMIFTLWSAAQGIHAIQNGLNRVHRTYENRNWLLLRIRAMLYTVVYVAILAATLLIIVLGSTLHELIKPYLSGLPDYLSSLYALRYVIMFVYLVFLFLFIYRNLPNLDRLRRREYGFRNQLPGALFSAAAWFALSLGISIYVNDFNGFSIYGGLTRLAIMMVWLYFCIVCMMLGAEFNVVYHGKIKSFTFKKLFRKLKAKVKDNRK